METIVSLTTAATARVRKLLREGGAERAALRLFVAGGGCSGYQYGMAIAREPEEDDLVIEHDGVRLLVDPESAPLLKGAEIDYVDDIMKSGFTISNPNAVQSCACGTSFTTADRRRQDPSAPLPLSLLTRHAAMSLDLADDPPSFLDPTLIRHGRIEYRQSAQQLLR